MKKRFALLLSAILVMGLFPVTAFAETTEETVSQDWINIPIDSGMSSGTTYSKVTNMLRAEGSTQSLMVQTGTSASNLTFNTQSAVLSGILADKVDMTEGMIGGYFYFGEQTPYATIRLTDKSWNGGAALGLKFLDAGDGWYYGYREASDIYFYESQVANGANREEIIRIIFGFNANTTVYIDGLMFPTQFPSSGVVLPETAERDWTNMYKDSGMSTASYEMSSEQVAPDSQQALKITTADGNVGNVVLHSEYTVIQGELDALPDFSTGKISAWFYFGDQRPMAFLRGYDSGWNGGNTGIFEFVDMGEGWYYGSVAASDVSFSVSVTNAVPSEIIRIAIGVPGGYTVYVDNMQWEAVTVTEAVEQENDLLAISSVVEEYTTVTGENYGYENSTDMVSGTKSLYSKKFTAAAGVSGQPSIRYQLPKSYDMTQQALTVDLNLNNAGLSFRAVRITLQDSLGDTVVSALVDNIYGLKWNRIEVDLYKFLLDGKKLSDVKYITFTFFFDRDTDKDREVYIDNVTITPYQTVNSPLNGTSALYIGDSISIARPFKGWAGLLEERYGVARTNVSVGGTTFSTIGAQIKNQLDNVPADSQFDYVILDGGINDLYLGATDFGEVSDTPITAEPANFDDSTAIGAFEQLLCMLKQRFPTAKIGYVITYQRDSKWVDGFVPKAIAVCEKWGVSYLCLPETYDFIQMFNSASGSHTTDTVHANVAGYELIMEYLPQWMESIPEPVIPEPEAPEDFLSNAASAAGQLQSEVTNGSKTAWELAPTLGTTHNWAYLSYTLNQAYTISDRMLVMDVMPVNMTNFRINLSTINGNWLTGVTSTYLTVGQWNKVTFDLSAYADTYADMSKFELGVEIVAEDGAEYAIYIDNAYLVLQETYEDDLINLGIDAGDSTAGTYERVYNMVKDGNSGVSLKLQGTEDQSAKVSFTTNNTFGDNYDMSTGILGAWFYFGDQKPSATVTFCGNWKASIPAAMTFGENVDGWYYGQLDTSTISFYEEAGTMKDIERVRLLVPAGYTVYVDYLTYTPCAHSYEAVVTAPTATKEGYTTYTCSVCGDSYVGNQVPALGIGELKFSSGSLLLKENLTVRFAADASLFIEDAYTEPYAVFQVGVKTQTVTEYTVVDGKYLFACTNLAPSQIGDTITATLYATLGDTQNSYTMEYSVADYCYNMLAKTEDAALRTLLVDLLNYGAASQTYAWYKDKTLCNADLTAEQQAWGTAGDPALSSVLNTKYTEIADAKATWKAAGLVLENAVTMRFRLAAESTEGLSVKISAAGQEWTVSEFEAVAGMDGQYYAYFSGLTARQMRETVYLTVYEGDTAVSNTLSYSVETYAYNKQNEARLGDLVKAMMRYGDSAAAYLN